jgi:hypothetical protein
MLPSLAMLPVNAIVEVAILLYILIVFIAMPSAAYSACASDLIMKPILDATLATFACCATIRASDAILPAAALVAMDCMDARSALTILCAAEFVAMFCDNSLYA